jgi:MFS family permease
MDQGPRPLSQGSRILVLGAGFLGWLFAGVQLAVSSIVMREAAKDLLGAGSEEDFGLWFGWLTSGFLLGGAAGGYLFGWIGDKAGRKTAMAVSIACYSTFAGITYFVTSPWQLLLLRFAVGLGIGGMWPNGIALVSEAWPNMSRPLIAGVIGTAANVGIMLFSILTCFVHVTPDHWRWVMLLGLAPIILAALVAVLVPESPRWLALKTKTEEPAVSERTKSTSPLVEVFRPPLLRITILGIALGTIPLFGGWGSSNWANAWASQAGEQQEGSSEAEPTKADPALKARVLLARSAPGSLASLLGGVLATVIGRRRFYFFLSVACLFCAQYMFWFSHPSDPQFLWWTGALGLFSGFFFGWLPLCLPELFPTRVRSTGAGVSFNFGRIATALGILIAAGLLHELFHGDYAQIGRLTSLIYAVGAFVILLAPDTSEKGMED